MSLHPFPAAQVRQHLGHARATGLDRVIRAAARRHGVREDVALALASRESHIGQMPPLRADWTGDGGHGRGVMQVDDRWHQAFVRSHRNDDHAAHADYALGLLAQNLRALRNDYPAALAAYNGGPGRVRQALAAGRHPDTVTTGGDYSTDVLARARVVSAALGGVAASSGRSPDWGSTAMIAGGVALVLDPTLGALSGIALGLLAKAQAEGRIS